MTGNILFILLFIHSFVHSFIHLYFLKGGGQKSNFFVTLQYYYKKLLSLKPNIKLDMI